MSWLKHFFKKYFLFFWIKERFAPSVQISQRQLFHYYSDLAKLKEVPPLNETGFRVFSQFEEDGKLLFIFSVLGMSNKTFVEFGSDDGVNSNSANLFFIMGGQVCSWMETQGLLIGEDVFFQNIHIHTCIPLNLFVRMSIEITSMR
jgi:hypothetical protein